MLCYRVPRYVQMVLGLSHCQMAFYMQQKAFEMPGVKQGASGKNASTSRPANVREILCVNKIHSCERALPWLLRAYTQHCTLASKSDRDHYGTCGIVNT